jgi:tetratricopeptide (TPR) repeat protein
MQKGFGKILWPTGRMMRGILMPGVRFAAVLLACSGVAVVAAAPAAAQTSYSPYAETPAAALARYVRTLASSPRDFSTLIQAGRAALAMGDTQAAAGFFARADDVNPNSPLPHAGMGAVEAAEGKPHAALPHFTRAEQLGAPIATFGADRGLAYDLLGQQAQAQADYRAALGGTDSDEARRRLALSLAISGNRAAALEALEPLQAKNDAAAGRCRAFILALTGDSSGAMVAIDAAMPGSWASVSPFLQRLPTLQAAEKAAAVNLGIFPDANGTAFAYAAPQADRLAEVDNLVKGPVATPAPSNAVQPSWHSAPVTQVSYSVPAPKREEAAPPKAAAKAKGKKIWLQLASGPNPDALPVQFQRIKSKNRDLFEGIKGYVAKGPDRARLLVGPFRNGADAETFAEGLESVNAFKWTNSDSDTIVPLGTN